MAKKEKPENLGALAFWLILIAIALIPLLWLQIWAYQNLNIKGFIVGNIFVIFILITFALDYNKHLYPSKSTFSQNSFYFSVGLVFGTIMSILSAGGKSVFALFTVSQQYLLSEISAQLPLFWSNFANVIGAPVSEELLFMISIPAIIFIIIEFVGTKIKIFKEPLLQVAIVAGVVGPLFAFFHVGNLALMGFIISAIFFRVLVIGLVHGEGKANILPFVSILPAFGVGYHIANNLMFSGGWAFFFQTMMLEPFGWGVILMMIVFIIGGLWHIGGKFVRRKK